MINEMVKISSIATRDIANNGLILPPNKASELDIPSIRLPRM